MWINNQRTREPHNLECALRIDVLSDKSALEVHTEKFWLYLANLLKWGKQADNLSKTGFPSKIKKRIKIPKIFIKERIAMY